MKRLNSLLIRISRSLKGEFVLGYPEKILVEPTNACNLACPLCPTGAGTLGRPVGQLRESDFMKIVDEVRGYTKYIEFAGYGEPIISKDIFKMIRYASEAGIYTHMHSNLPMLNSSTKIMALVNSRLDRLTVSIDGVTQQTYEKYRIGGDLDLLFNNISKLIEAKRKSDNQNLKIVGQMVVARQNEHEVELFKQKAESRKQKAESR